MHVRRFLTRPIFTRFPALAIILGALAGFAAVSVASAQTVPDPGLLICKLAGPGVSIGTTFTFTVTDHTQGTTHTVSVPAVAAGTICEAPGTGVNTLGFQVGDSVFVQETVPSGIQVTSIVVGDSAILVSSDLHSGSAQILIGGQHNTISFTDQTAITGCTLTQGFFKNHPDALPATLTLGNITYTRDQLVTILETPVMGNGAIALAHQLIAAKANMAGGASAPSSVQSAVSQADALLTNVNLLSGGFLSPSATSALTDVLDRYNEGLAAGAPSHCS